MGMVVLFHITSFSRLLRMFIVVASLGCRSRGEYCRYDSSKEYGSPRGPLSSLGVFYHHGGSRVSYFGCSSLVVLVFYTFFFRCVILIGAFSRYFVFFVYRYFRLF